MLMLDNPRIRSLPVCVVYHSDTLIIIGVHRLALKSQASVLQLSVTVSEVSVDGPRIDDRLAQTVIPLLILQVIHSRLDVASLEQLVYNYVIAAYRNSLKQVIKIIIVIRKTHWNPFDNKGR